MVCCDFQCYISLGRVHLAISARAFHLGKYHSGNNLFAMGHLDSSEIAARKVLEISTSDRHNPLFLPREVFRAILQYLDSSTKTLALRTSRKWKSQMESEPSLWNNVGVVWSSVMSGPGKSPFELFSQF